MPNTERHLRAVEKPATTAAAQIGGVKHIDDLRAGDLAGAEPCQQCIAARVPITVEIDVSRDLRRVTMLRQSAGDTGRISMIDVIMPHFGNWRGIATAHARSSHDAHLRPHCIRQGREQALRARQIAGKAVADSNGQGRRRRFILVHDVEMRIEGGDFVDFGLRHTEFGGQRRNVARRKMAVAILDEVKIFDQKIATRSRLPRRTWISSTAVGSTWRPFGTDRARRLLVPGGATHVQTVQLRAKSPPKAQPLSGTLPPTYK